MGSVCVVAGISFPVMLMFQLKAGRNEKSRLALIGEADDVLM